ncbi:hypothetical protein TAL182_CH01123 [Rhizobium sp. TAL182]|uniref:hypothetical protein n=1 Tax=Rhizobium sp. TAL182 TaxID=2020313 RepID=UPI000A20F69E|nr:hypothetical protein [Rhizobium sp. TAL182]ARO22936.1 hypothetical protein TAL182_CH01123 [Rhizobium sp. TAL182]
MPNMVKIDGVLVDIDDPCALATALRAVRYKRITGGQIEESEIRSPVMQQRIKVASSTVAQLDAEIQRLDDLCRQKNGQCRVSRRWRFRY